MDENLSPAFLISESSPPNVPASDLFIARVILSKIDRSTHFLQNLYGNHCIDLIIFH